MQVDQPLPLRYEWGPEALAPGSHDVLELAESLGIEALPVPTDSRARYIVRAGAPVAVPTSLGAFLRSPLLSRSGKLRLFTEPFRRRAVGLDGSIADFCRHRLGHQALDMLVDPIVAGIHAGDPAQLSARACFPQLVKWVEEHGSIFRALLARGRPTGKRVGMWKPRGGMQRLTDALARALGDRLHLGRGVRALRPRADGWIADTEAGPIAANHVVLALPVAATRDLLSGPAPEASAALSGIDQENLVVALHAYRRDDVEHSLAGFGYLVPSGEGLRHLGTLFSSSIDPECTGEDTVLLRTLLGGALRPQLVRASDTELQTLVNREVGPLLGISGAPLWSTLLRHRQTLPRFGLGHPAALETLRQSLPTGLHVLGNFTAGIGLPKLVSEAQTLARAITGSHELRPAAAPRSRCSRQRHGLQPHTTARAASRR